jgi:hypothetical protein
VGKEVWAIEKSTMQAGSSSFPEDAFENEVAAPVPLWLQSMQTARKPGERRASTSADWEQWMSLRDHSETQLAQHLRAAEDALRMLNTLDVHLLNCLEEVLREVLGNRGAWRIEAVRWANRESPWSVEDALDWRPGGLEVQLHRARHLPATRSSGSVRNPSDPGLRWKIPLFADPEIASLPPNPPSELTDALDERPGWWQEVMSEGRWQWAKHRQHAQLAFRAYRQQERQFLAETDPWKSVWAQILLSGRVVKLHNHTCILSREASRWPLEPSDDVPQCIGMTLPKPRSAGWQVREFRVQSTLRSGNQWRIYGIRESYDPQRGIHPAPFETSTSPGILLDALIDYLFPWPVAPFDRGRGM